MGGTGRNFRHFSAILWEKRGGGAEPLAKRPRKYYDGGKEGRYEQLKNR